MAKVTRSTSSSEEFFGTTKEDGTDREQRDSSRQAQERLFDESPVRGDQIRRDIHNRWGAATDQVMVIDCSHRTRNWQLDSRGAGTSVAEASRQEGKGVMRGMLH